LQLVPAVPVAVLLLLGSLDVLPWALWLALPVGVLGGVVTAWWWGRIAYRRLEAQGPELLAAVHTAD
jgi:ABC-2 type transport system permease protein